MNNPETTSAINPIGKYTFPEHFAAEQRQVCIEELRKFPQLLRAATAHLTDEQLSLSYRPGGWSIRQIVHHCADSHMNAYVRTKLMLTEDQPTVKPYDENLWAAMPDYTMPIQSSLILLEGMHERWAYTFEHATPNQYSKTYYHPQYQKTVTLDELISLYAWHGKHHLGQILSVGV